MKKIYVILSVVASVAVMSSCKGWLTVDSDDRVLENKLFGSQSGFYTALNGVYVDLVNASLYSGTLGASTFDVMAQYYNTETDNHSFGSLALYQAEAKRMAVSDTWTRAYFLIMNINQILEYCQSRRSVLTERDHDIIKGECLGLRALLHFELFRIFGPIYGLAPAAAAIPYVDVSQPQVRPVLKASEVAVRILDDLSEAERLLSRCDPVLTEGKNETDDGGRNLYGYRNLRFNYFAVKALAARVNMYLGYDYRKDALRQAEQVISEASRFFPFSTREQVSGQDAVGGVAVSAEDRVLSSDVLFAVYNIKRGQDIYEKYFSNTLEKNRLLALSENGYSNLYPEAGDLRTCQWQQKRDVLGGDVRTMVKYEAMEVSGRQYPYMIPVLRMSEMYLIAAECYAALEPVDMQTAYERLNALRSARKTSAVDSAIEAHIEDEYAREFVGEGQLFWYYKRRNAPFIPRLYDRTQPDVSMTQDRYLFVLPQGEDGFRD